MFANKTIQSIKKIIGSPSEDDIFSILLSHKWNSAEGTRANLCLAKMIAEVFRPDSSSVDIDEESAFSALKILSHYPLLRSDLETYKANFHAITKVDTQYADYVAWTLSRLNQSSLFTGDQAQANREAITLGRGRYARDMCDALHELNNSGLLIGDQAQANFSAITQSGGQYAPGIALALSIIRDGLLRADQAKALRDAITKGRGDIVAVLSILEKSDLLTGDQTQANFSLLMNYVDQANQRHHGISFLVKKIEQFGVLTQDEYNIAMLNTHEFDAQSCAIFSQIFSLPEIVLSEGFDPVYLLKDMLEFCEYVATYLGDSDFIAQWMPDILNCTQTHFGVVNTIFFRLFENDDNREQKQKIMLAIIEMLRKNDEPEATFSTAILEKIKQVDLDIFTLTSAIEFISHEEKKLPENEKLTQEDDMKNNEAIVVLLSFILDRNLECFMTLSHSLCEHMEQRKQPATLTPSSSSFFSKKEGSVVSPMSIKPNF